MKNLLVSDIKDYVKTCLDEMSNNEDAALVADSSAVEDLEKQVEKFILPAVRKIHLDAPNVLLKEGVILTNTAGQQGTVTLTTSAIGSTGYYKTYFVVPVDFLRIITLRMSDWERPIQTLVGEDSAEYRKQQNPHLMGTPLRPIGALVHWNSRGQIELYSSSSNVVTLSAGQYVPVPDFTTVNTANDAVPIIETLEYPCLNQITAEVMRSLGKYQEAQHYERLAVQPFRIDPEWARLNPLDGERFNTKTN